MDRTALVGEARVAGKNAVHNLRLIRKQPDKMLPGKARNAEIYLSNMIRVAKLEMKNDRLAGRSKLRFRLKSLVMSILTLDQQERKGVENCGL